MAHDCYELMKATASLPSPQGVVLEILRLSEDENTTIEDITRVVESDPAVSGRILKVVNSPLIGVMSKVASIKRATILLGFRTVANMALSLSLISDNRRNPCSAFDYDTFWSESLARGVAAGRLADQLEMACSDQAFTCALLSQIGRLAFATAYPDQYADVLSAADGNRQDLVRLEAEFFGMDHDTLTAEMMVDWHLPEIFALAVRINRDAVDVESEPAPQVHQLAKVLRLSGLIADVLVAVKTKQVSLPSLVQEAIEQGITSDGLSEAFDTIRTEWRDAGRIFAVSTQEVPSFEEISARCGRQRDKLNKTA